MTIRTRTGIQTYFMYPHCQTVLNTRAVHLNLVQQVDISNIYYRYDL